MEDNKKNVLQPSNFNIEVKHDVNFVKHRSKDVANSSFSPENIPNENDENVPIDSTSHRLQDCLEEVINSSISDTSNLDRGADISHDLSFIADKLMDLKLGTSSNNESGEFNVDTWSTPYRKNSFFEESYSETQLEYNTGDKSEGLCKTDCTLGNKEDSSIQDRNTDDFAKLSEIQSQSLTYDDVCKTCDNFLLMASDNDNSHLEYFSVTNGSNTSHETSSYSSLEIDSETEDVFDVNNTSICKNDMFNTNMPYNKQNLCHSSSSNILKIESKTVENENYIKSEVCYEKYNDVGEMSNLKEITTSLDKICDLGHVSETEGNSTTFDCHISENQSISHEMIQRNWTRMLDHGEVDIQLSNVEAQDARTNLEQMEIICSRDNSDGKVDNDVVLSAFKAYTEINKIDSDGEIEITDTTLNLGQNNIAIDEVIPATNVTFDETPNTITNPKEDTPMLDHNAVVTAFSEDIQLSKVDIDIEAKDARTHLEQIKIISSTDKNDIINRDTKIDKDVLSAVKEYIEINKIDNNGEIGITDLKLHSSQNDITIEGDNNKVIPAINITFDEVQNTITMDHNTAVAAFNEDIQLSKVDIDSEVKDARSNLEQIETISSRDNNDVVLSVFKQYIEINKIDNDGEIEITDTILNLGQNDIAIDIVTPAINVTFVEAQNTITNPKEDTPMLDHNAVVTTISEDIQLSKVDLDIDAKDAQTHLEQIKIISSRDKNDLINSDAKTDNDVVSAVKEYIEINNIDVDVESEITDTKLNSRQVAIEGGNDKLICAINVTFDEKQITITNPKENTPMLDLNAVAAPYSKNILFAKIDTDIEMEDAQTNLEQIHMISSRNNNHMINIDAKVDNDVVTSAFNENFEFDKIDNYGKNGIMDTKFNSSQNDIVFGGDNSKVIPAINVTFDEAQNIITNPKKDMAMLDHNTVVTAFSEDIRLSNVDLDIESKGAQTNLEQIKIILSKDNTDMINSNEKVDNVVVSDFNENFEVNKFDNDGEIKIMDTKLNSRQNDIAIEGSDVDETQNAITNPKENTHVLDHSAIDIQLSKVDIDIEMNDASINFGKMEVIAEDNYDMSSNEPNGYIDVVAEAISEDDISKNDSNAEIEITNIQLNAAQNEIDIKRCIEMKDASINLGKMEVIAGDNYDMSSNEPNGYTDVVAEAISEDDISKNDSNAEIEITNIQLNAAQNEIDIKRYIEMKDASINLGKMEVIAGDNYDMSSNEPNGYTDVVAEAISEDDISKNDSNAEIEITNIQLNAAQNEIDIKRYIEMKDASINLGKMEVIAGDNYDMSSNEPNGYTDVVAEAISEDDISKNDSNAEIEITNIQLNVAQNEIDIKRCIEMKDASINLGKMEVIAGDNYDMSINEPNGYTDVVAEAISEDDISKNDSNAEIEITNIQLNSSQNEIDNKSCDTEVMSISFTLDETKYRITNPKENTHMLDHSALIAAFDEDIQLSKIDETKDARINLEQINIVSSTDNNDIISSDARVDNDVVAAAFGEDNINKIYSEVEIETTHKRNSGPNEISGTGNSCRIPTINIILCDDIQNQNLCGGKHAEVVNSDIKLDNNVGIASVYNDIQVSKIGMNVKKEDALLNSGQIEDIVAADNYDMINDEATTDRDVVAAAFSENIISKNDSDTEIKITDTQLNSVQNEIAIERCDGEVRPTIIMFDETQSTMINSKANTHMLDHKVLAAASDDNKINKIDSKVEIEIADKLNSGQNEISGTGNSESRIPTINIMVRDEIQDVNPSREHSEVVNSDIKLDNNAGIALVDNDIQVSKIGTNVKKEDTLLNSGPNEDIVAEDNYDISDEATEDRDVVAASFSEDIISKNDSDTEIEITDTKQNLGQNEIVITKGNSDITHTINIMSDDTQNITNREIIDIISNNVTLDNIKLIAASDEDIYSSKFNAYVGKGLTHINLRGTEIISDGNNIDVVPNTEIPCDKVHAYESDKIVNLCDPSSLSYTTDGIVKLHVQGSLSDKTDKIIKLHDQSSLSDGNNSASILNTEISCDNVLASESGKIVSLCDLSTLSDKTDGIIKLHDQGSLNNGNNSDVISNTEIPCDMVNLSESDKIVNLCDPSSLSYTIDGKVKLHVQGSLSDKTDKIIKLHDQSSLSDGNNSDSIFNTKISCGNVLASESDEIVTLCDVSTLSDEIDGIIKLHDQGSLNDGNNSDVISNTEIPCDMVHPSESDKIVNLCIASASLNTSDEIIKLYDHGSLSDRNNSDVILNTEMTCDNVLASKSDGIVKVCDPSLFSYTTDDIVQLHDQGSLSNKRDKIIKLHDQGLLSYQTDGIAKVHSPSSLSNESNETVKLHDLDSFSDQTDMILKLRDRDALFDQTDGIIKLHDQSLLSDETEIAVSSNNNGDIGNDFTIMKEDTIHTEIGSRTSNMNSEDDEEFIVCSEVDDGVCKKNNNLVLDQLDRSSVDVKLTKISSLFAQTDKIVNFIKPPSRYEIKSELPDGTEQTDGNGDTGDELKVLLKEEDKIPESKMLSPVSLNTSDNEINKLTNSDPTNMICISTPINSLKKFQINSKLFSPYQPPSLLDLSIGALESTNFCYTQTTSHNLNSCTSGVKLLDITMSNGAVLPSYDKEIDECIDLDNEDMSDTSSNNTVIMMDLSKHTPELDNDAETNLKEENLHLKNENISLKERLDRAIMENNQLKSELNIKEICIQDSNNALHKKEEEMKAKESVFENEKQELMKTVIDLHEKYEVGKNVAEVMKKNEESLKNTLFEYETITSRLEKKYELLKEHANIQLAKANEELDFIIDKNKMEQTRLNVTIQRLEMQLASLQDSLDKKTKENRELTTICDELIAMVNRPK